MGRKIILLSDGTGNSSAKVWRTNVWRIFESLDLSGNDQIAAYDDGVGTSSFKPAAVLGGAFGFGLKRNVIDLYKFACRNHRNDDDEISQGNRGLSRFPAPEFPHLLEVPRGYRSLAARSGGRDRLLQGR
jgi:uncharacterized protein (DUF2235 family)